MLSDDLTTLMRSAETATTPRPIDLGEIRRLGRRRRFVRRTGVAAGSVLIASVCAAVALVGPGQFNVLGGGDGVTGVATQTNAVTGLNHYEKRVLRAIPAAYAVQGTVVVPGPLDETSPVNTRLSTDRIVGNVRPLPFHAYSDPGYVTSTYRYPRFMRGNEPRNTQVRADNGPVSLACASWPHQSGCTVAVVMRGAHGSYYYHGGLGADDFLTPGAPMELFLDVAYPKHHLRDTVIGGFDGTRAARVVVQTVDGDRVDATVDSGTIHTGDTLFWAETRSEVASVTAYASNGDVVASHRVRSCSGGVDCEVR